MGEDVEFVTFYSDKKLTVLADAGQIEQVFMNLATNARDAMKASGKFIIRTDQVELNNEFIKDHGYGNPGTYALITIEDTGQGIDEETKEKIFEPFFTTKEVGKGTGLGLSMVYGIIQQHDGYIDVQSELGKGAIFEIYLPIMPTSVEEIMPGVDHIMKGGTETVLVAEDDIQVRELTKEVLEGSGYKVLEATNGENALSVFNNSKDTINLLLLDVIMPKKNGKEVYDAIRQKNQDIKAIFISGYDADIIQKKGVMDRGVNFVSKPVSPDELLYKVREVLDH